MLPLELRIWTPGSRADSISVTLVVGAFSSWSVFTVATVLPSLFFWIPPVPVPVTTICSSCTALCRSSKSTVAA